MEKEFFVNPVKILFKCNECDDGWLSFTGEVIPGVDNKPKFEHQCSKCRKYFQLNKQYPAIKFREIAERNDDNRYSMSDLQKN